MKKETRALFISLGILALLIAIWGGAFCCASFAPRITVSYGFTASHWLELPIVLTSLFLGLAGLVSLVVGLVGVK